MKLLVTALEPSANLHLKSFLERVENRELEISGIFDDSLGNPMFSSKEFGVMGVFAILPKIVKAKKRINALLKAGKNFDKFLLIDSPAFNLPLAKKLKEKYPEKEVIYYILPKVWAWRENRKWIVDKYVDTPISIFPFEKQYFQEINYYGNPLLNEISYFREKPLEKGAISFLPGSRKGEIENLMPIFRELASEIDGEKILVIPEYVEKLKIYGDISQFTVLRNTEEALKKSRFAYICSGTATLEASLMGVPFVLLYKTSSIEYWLGKRFVKIPYIGLANIIFLKAGIEEQFHNEYLQDFDVATLISEIDMIDKDEFLENSQKLRKILRGDSFKGLEKEIFS